jgi:hypothetical protein
MSVIPLTVFFSLGLVFFFVAMFLREHRYRLFANAERDSLLPLADEQPILAQGRNAAPSAPLPSGSGHVARDARAKAFPPIH